MACSACGKDGHNKRSPKCKVQKQRRDAATKGRAVKSKAKQEASKINGAKGGAPADERHATMFADLEPPPSDPLARVVWAQDLLGQLTVAYLQGRIAQKILDNVRRLCDSMIKGVPRERIYRAEQLVLSGKIKKKPKAAGRKTEAVRPSRGPIR